MGLILILMLIYYRFFGLVADIATFIKSYFIMCHFIGNRCHSNFTGYCGDRINGSMAVDANVLIYERIREELRNGMSPQGAIHAGYEKAFAPF